MYYILLKHVTLVTNMLFQVIMCKAYEFKHMQFLEHNRNSELAPPAESYIV